MGVLTRPNVCLILRAGRSYAATSRPHVEPGESSHSPRKSSVTQLVALAEPLDYSLVRVSAMEREKPPADTEVVDGIEPLYTRRAIADRVQELGTAITNDYAGRSLVLVCILKGSFIFAADLARAIALPLRIEFLGVRSYGQGTTSSGVVQITQDLANPIEGEDVLLVEDIVDTGLTIAHLLELLRTRLPRSLKVCALLHKPARLCTPVPIEYLGFTIEDRFVVGYGLDRGELYRNLPYIGVLD